MKKKIHKYCVWYRRNKGGRTFEYCSVVELSFKITSRKKLDKLAKKIDKNDEFEGAFITKFKRI